MLNAVPFSNGQLPFSIGNSKFGNGELDADSSNAYNRETLVLDLNLATFFCFRWVCFIYVQCFVSVFNIV